MRRNSSTRRSRARENKAFTQEDEKPEKLKKRRHKSSTASVRKITNARNAISRWQDLTTRRRTKASNNFVGKKDSYPTVLDPDFSGSQNNAEVQKRNRALIMHFITLDRSCQEDDQVDLDFLETLLNGDSAADINCTDKYGQTVLHEAAREWHTNVAKFLIKNNANINAKDLYGRTPLHVAAATDYNEMVQVLLDCGADVEALAKGYQTPLHYAAGNDAVKSLRVLLEYGADKEARDYKSRTPVFLAAELDRSETARELVEKGAEVAVVDKAGYKCITHMIIKMAPVANMALDKFHRKDRRNRKQFYQLSHLECDTYDDYDNQSDDSSVSDPTQKCLAKSPLEAIILHRQLDLILHPVITRLIDVKWHQFGRRLAWVNLMWNLVYVIIWTVFAVFGPWYTRPVYDFPTDGARVVFLVLGTLFSLYFVVAEIVEVIKSRKKYQEWKRWRITEISTDLDVCHPKWPDEKNYLESEIKSIEESVPSYFQDAWNYFDWVAYCLTFIVVLTHLIDVAIPKDVPVCCVAPLGCSNLTSMYLCNEEGSFVNNRSLTVWNNRIFVITIICLWLRLMKYARAFRELGPFIVMLTKLGSDILRFLYLYLEFLIPFSVSFWMTFGNAGAIVSSMSQVDRLVVSLYRLTLVDDYQFDEMTGYDVVMGYFLIVLFTFLAAVLCLNLFIALLSDTFQRVYDNAKANAVMQQASLLLSFQDPTRKRRFQEYLKRWCDPEEQDYDDDLTTPGDDNLQKVTIQIKEQMDFLLERLALTKTIDAGELEYQLQQHDGSQSKLKKAASRNRDLQTSNVQNSQVFSQLLQPPGGDEETSDDVSSSAGGDGRLDSGVRCRILRIGRQVEEMQRSQVAQEGSYRKLRQEMGDIKRMLREVMTSQASSISRLNNSILMTRPLTSPSPSIHPHRRHDNVVESSLLRHSSSDLASRLGASQQFLPGSTMDDGDDDGGTSAGTLTPRPQPSALLHMADVRVDVTQPDDVTADNDDSIV